MTDGTIVGVNDFPTPSGWVLSRKNWKPIIFDETFPLAPRQRIPRSIEQRSRGAVPRLERYAPHSRHCSTKSGRASSLQNSNQNIRLTSWAWNASGNKDRQYTGSGMYKIANDTQTKAETEAECGRLNKSIAAFHTNQRPRVFV